MSNFILGLYFILGAFGIIFGLGEAGLFKLQLPGRFRLKLKGGVGLVLVGLVFMYLALTYPAPQTLPAPSTMVHNHGATITDPALSPVEIKMSSAAKAVNGGEEVSLSFEVIEKSTNKVLDNLEISHEKPMHVVGVRKDDIGEFFHIHPSLENGKYIVKHVIPQGGTYLIWPGIFYQGNHINLKMPELVVGAPQPVEFRPNYNRTQNLGDLNVTMTAAGQFSVGTSHNFGFAVTNTSGETVPVGKYLQENAHINIVSADTEYYNHLHTNYGSIGLDSGSFTTTKRWSLVPVAQADPGHEDGAHGIEEDSLVFTDNDLRIRNVFPRQGLYKIFVEFITLENPSQVRRAEFWIEVGPTQAEITELPLWTRITGWSVLAVALALFIFQHFIRRKLKS